MHPNPAFRNTAEPHSLAFARARGFGILTASTDGLPLLAHVPFLLAEDGSHADLHLVRSNPLARLDRGHPALIAVNGPDGYVSPDWYGVADQVPTWNYVAVHLKGRLDPLPDAAMRDMLDRQSAEYEARLAPKPAWVTEKMSDGVMDRMMRAIRPFRFRIDAVDSTWKLGQNKPETVRIAAADHVAEGGPGQDLARLSRLMRHPPEAG